MATIKVRFFVNELSNVMTKYDLIKVYRSDLKEGVYAEITGVGTRIPLVAGISNYEYIDTTAPSDLYWYKTAYFNSVTLLESSTALPIQGSDAGMYVSLQDIRDEGIEEDELSNARAIELSLGWQQWFEARTGQFFSPKQLDFKVDGNGSRVLWLPVPIIELTDLYINGETTALDPSYYIIFNRYFPYDDRRNPRVKLVQGERTIFQGRGSRVFVSGDLNQRLVGTFGYVEQDRSTPRMVKRAILTLINITKENMGDGEIDALKSGRIIEEVTDRHRVRYADLWDQIGAWSVTGYTEVDEAIRMYRRPAHVGMARSFISTSV